MHVAMGAVVLAISLCLIFVAIVVGPVLRYLGIGKSSRIAFGTMCICLAAYLGWIASLFFGDELGPANYTPELYALRIITLVATVWFLIGAIKCSLKLGGTKGLVRENGTHDPE